MRSEDRTFIILLLSVLIEMIGSGIIIPLLPFLFTDPDSAIFILGSSKNVDVYGYILLGFLASVYPLAQFIASPFLGSLSDNKGRKALLLCSILGSFIARIVTGISVVTGNIPLLFSSRIFDGLTGGNISIAQASIADISDDTNRSKRFAHLGAMIGLGFIIGPFLGGILSTIDISFIGSALPFYVAGCLSLLSFFVNVFFLQETNKKGVRLTNAPFRFISSIKKAFKLHSLRNILITAFLFSIGFAFYTSFFNVFMIERFGFNERQIAYLFSYIGIVIFISQGFIVQKISPIYGSKTILKYSLIASGCGMLATYVSSSWYYVAFSAFIFGVSNAMSTVELSAAASKESSSIGYGVGMGAFTSMNSLGQAFPPLVAGIIANGTNPTIPILIGALCCMASGIWFNTMYINQT